MTSGREVGRLVLDGYGLQVFGSLLLDGWLSWEFGYGVNQHMSGAKVRKHSRAWCCSVTNMRIAYSSKEICLIRSALKAMICHFRSRKRSFSHGFGLAAASHEIIQMRNLHFYKGHCLPPRTTHPTHR